MKTEAIFTLMLAAVSLNVVADEIKPIPKTSKEALAQCEATNRNLGITEDCRETDFVYKSLKETEARNAAAKADAAKAQAAAKAKADAARAQAAKPSPRIGMSKMDVIENTNWGKAYQINRTITASGTQEQWVYGSGQYLYFRNGTLTAIQD